MFSNIGMELGVTSAIGWGRKVIKGVYNIKKIKTYFWRHYFLFKTLHEKQLTGSLLKFKQSWLSITYTLS